MQWPGIQRCVVAVNNVIRIFPTSAEPSLIFILYLLLRIEGDEKENNDERTKLAIVMFIVTDDNNNGNDDGVCVYRGSN